MDDIRKSILERNAQRKLNILKSFKDVNELVEKAHMDFGSSGPPRGNNKLVQKKVTDKRGHQTTRWVKNGEDDKTDEDNQEQEDVNQSNADKATEGMNQESSIDRDFSAEEAAAHAKDTPTEELLKFIETADDSKIDLIEAAEEELRMRGEIGTNEMGMNYEDSTDEELYEIARTKLDSENWTTEMEEISQELENRKMRNEDWMTPNPREEQMSEAMGEQGIEGEINWDDPNSVTSYISENRDAIVDMMIEDPLLNAISAAKIHNASNTDNSDTHAKIDAAQAALNDLKGATGHPDSYEEGMLQQPQVGDMVAFESDGSVIPSGQWAAKVESYDEEHDYYNVSVEDGNGNKKSITIGLEDIIENLSNNPNSSNPDDSDDGEYELDDYISFADDGQPMIDEKMIPEDATEDDRMIEFTSQDGKKAKGRVTDEIISNEYGSGYKIETDAVVPTDSDDPKVDRSETQTSYSEEDYPDENEDGENEDGENEDGNITSEDWDDINEEFGEDMAHFAERNLSSEQVDDFFDFLNENPSFKKLEGRNLMSKFENYLNDN